MYKITGIVALVTLLTGCSNTIDNPQEYFAWLENPENGITKTRTIGDITIKVKSLPAEYLCYQEIKGDANSQALIDSTLENYRYNKTFLVTIGPSPEAQSEFDITKLGVSSHEEFTARANELNFNMGRYFQLIVGDETYEPVFCEMENVYGLTYDRKFNLIFTPKEEKNELRNAEKAVLKFQDELFNTGISKFTYLKEQTDEVPKIAFWNQH